MVGNKERDKQTIRKQKKKYVDACKKSVESAFGWKNLFCVANGRRDKNCCGGIKIKMHRKLKLIQVKKPLADEISSMLQHFTVLVEKWQRILATMPE